MPLVMIKRLSVIGLAILGLAAAYFALQQMPGVFREGGDQTVVVQSHDRTKVLDEPDYKSGARDQGVGHPRPVLSEQRKSAAEAVPDTPIDRASGPVFAFGGDVNLGRRQNAITAKAGPEAALAKGMPSLHSADLAMVNLESVVATIGEHGVDKGEKASYYFRGRPELLDVLSAAGVDIVQTANNHSLDYGAGALALQNDWLDAMNMAHVGAGPDREAACSPVYRRAGDVAVAVLAVDATMERFAAGASTAGTCYLPFEDQGAWLRHFSSRIDAARRKADVVLVGVHWGPNFRSVPDNREFDLGHAIIDAGADAVLGHSAHRLQGVEVYKNRPILHDAGNMLFDFERGMSATGVFELILSREGVRQVWFRPALAGMGYTHLATGTVGKRILGKMQQLSADMGTRFYIQDDSTGVVDLDELPARRAAPHRDEVPPNPMVRTGPGPAGSPPQGCTVDKVPQDALIHPVRLGPVTLLGVRVTPAEIQAPRILWVETYWRAEEPIPDDLWLHTGFEPVESESGASSWTTDHEPCDWQWPTSRWEVGALYRDYTGVRPPGSRKVRNGKLQLRLGLLRDGRLTAPVYSGALLNVDLR